jgi:hypothetical protein
MNNHHQATGIFERGIFDSQTTGTPETTPE